MESRPGIPEGLIGVPIDAHTRVVAVARRPAWRPASLRRLARAAPVERASRAEAGATFQIINIGSSVPPPALAAFQHALDIWAGLINSPIPIEVAVSWTSPPGFLAHSNPGMHFRNFAHAPVPDVWYPVAQANALAGTDLDPGSSDVVVTFDGTNPNWYFGTDGNTPAGKYDFVTVAMHEIAHGIGFAGGLYGGGGSGSWGSLGSAFIYDHFTVNGAGQSLLNTSLFPNPSAALAAQLTSNNLFWNGPTGIAALNTRPKLYAPNPWVDGQNRSHDHLDEATYPPGDANSLMTPILNTAEAIHTPGPAALGMLADMGWTPDIGCTYTISATNLTFGPEAVPKAVIYVATAPTCPRFAFSNSPGFITLVGNNIGNGPGPVTFSLAANGQELRVGTLNVVAQTVTIHQNGTGPAITLDKTSLQFGAATAAGAFVSQTGAQIVRLRQSGGTGTVTWTASPTQPWLHVTPTSGSGSADLSVSVVAATGVPAAGDATGMVQLNYSGAGSIPSGPITVTLSTKPAASTSAPIGVIDTPPDFQTGITGSVPFTGWALDDIEIDRVTVCRAPWFPEAPGPNPQCGGAAEIFVGFGTRIDGARPDVQASFPAYPMNSIAGWGLMVLTNMLPSKGNGTYVFSAWAYDREGHASKIGMRVISCDNEHATKPFGAIDTPTQGGIASGSAFPSFGWALTPQPKTIPIDGSTITVFLDGSPIGHPTYNNFRADVAGLFPGLNNTNGAIGYRIIDTTALLNGVHTISWVVIDDQDAIEGIGSRYFTVSNGTGAVTAAPSTRAITTAQSIASAPLESGAVIGRRGFDLNAPWTSYAIGASGHAVIRGEELDRIELALGARGGETHSGFLRIGSELGALPIGSKLDPITGAFAWTPGVGFVGAYDLVFVRSRTDRVVSRTEVRVILQPKRGGLIGPQVVIDAPRSQQDVAQPFALSGWAANLGARDGTGVATIHVWAYPLAGGPPVFLGAGSYGDKRPDVAATHGDQFRASGFTLPVQGLVDGNYDLAVFAWDIETGNFGPPRVVRVTVR